MDAIDREIAAATFIKLVIERARNGTREDMRENLTAGPPGRKPSAAAVARHEWFRSLSLDDQTRVMGIVSESIDAAIFGVLVVLDGLSGGNPVEGVTSDFCLELKTYVDEAARAENEANSSVRINPSDSSEPLHDLFGWALENQPSG